MKDLLEKGMCLVRRNSEDGSIVPSSHNKDINANQTSHLIRLGQMNDKNKLEGIGRKI